MSEDTHIVEEGLDTSYQSTPSENPPILVAEAVQEPTAPSQKSDLPPLLAKVDGHVHVLGFSMRERRIFYETVMRLGAPPEDAYNSPWRTSCLNHKSQKEFNVYSSLFLRHAAEPSPEHSEFFVDGVPREGLNRQNVLTRMAIMSLIRKKVKEFEDLNSDWSVQEDHEKLLADRRAALKASQVHQSQALEKKGEAGNQLIIAEASQDFTAPKLHKPTPVQFNIAEGGFLELHKLWALEEEALMEGKEYEVWNRRHDYWLLAGIVQHGYGRYRDIVSDVRFAIIVKPSSLDEAFFEHRFKLLEQALIIEEQLRRINLLSLGDISTKNTLQLRKLFLQLQDVVAEARNDVCRQPTLLNSIPKGIPLRSILSASITPPGPYEADSFDDTSSNQPYHNSRPKFVAILAGKVTKGGP